jgi:hypothetical protein
MQCSSCIYQTKYHTKHVHYNFILPDVGNATTEKCMTEITLCAYVGLVNKTPSYSTVISRNLEK